MVDPYNPLYISIESNKYLQGTCHQYIHLLIFNRFLRFIRENIQDLIFTIKCIIFKDFINAPNVQSL